MPRRDLLHDTPGLQFVGNFAPSPLTDWAPRLLWRFARDGSESLSVAQG